MWLRDSLRCKPCDVSADIRTVVESIDGDYLKFVVEAIALPRHFVAEAANNRWVGEWIAGGFAKMGYRAAKAGSCDNIIATSDGFDECRDPKVLIGAHYDSVPGTPGADDNASAVAVAMACARAFAGSPLRRRVMFVCFNREEDALAGSTEFVEQYLRERPYEIAMAHVLEMVGYYTFEPGTQRLPKGLPIRLPERGDFLGIIANRTSNRKLGPILRLAKSCLPDFHVLGLEVWLGLEKYAPHLLRSDHAPFWRAGIPAMMWTDTAEFRNANYHQKTDTPETLDYGMMKKAAQLLAAAAAVESACGKTRKIE